MNEMIIRSSSLSGFSDCPRRWFARVARKEVTAAGYTLRSENRGVGAAIGISVHKSASMTLEAKASSGRLPPATFAADVAFEMVREEIRQGVTYDQRFTLNSDDAEKQVLRMAASYYGEVAPTVNAILIEQNLEASVPWSTENLVVSGRPDVVAREPDAIDDLKTGTRIGYHLPQIGSYSLIVRSNDIADVKIGRVTWVPRLSVKKPQPRPITHEIDIGRAELIATNVLKHIDSAIRIWRHGDQERNIPPGAPEAFLTNPSSILCSQKYCVAHSCGSNGWCLDYEKGDE
jgi:hypothetical protein